MKLSTFSLFFLSLVIVLTNCTGNRQDTGSSAKSDTLWEPQSGSLMISGAFGMYPTALRWAEAYMKKYPGVEIGVRAGGTGQGIADLREGKVQLAMISRELTGAEKESGLLQVPVTKDAIGLLVNAGNPHLETIMEVGINPRLLRELYVSAEETTWGQLLETVGKEPVTVLVREDLSGAEEVLANYLFLKGEDLKGKPVRGDDSMIEAIRADLHSLGFVNLAYVFDEKTGKPADGIMLVPIDTDMDGNIDRAEQTFDSIEKMHRAIWLGLYPKNLCRRMSFVCQGIPEDPLVVNFLAWVLGEGQKMAEKSGCCEFNHVEIQSSLEIIGE